MQKILRSLNKASVILTSVLSCESKIRGKDLRARFFADGWLRMTRRGLFLMGVMMITLPVLGQAEDDMSQKIEVRSSAFGDGESIPSDFTCDGANMSPPVEWSGVPFDAESLVVMADDPDAPAGDWVHWLVYDLPPSLTQLSAGIPEGGRLSGGGSQGRTDFGALGYGGPCPPSGIHRYFFRVYALDAMLHLKPGATKKELLKAMQGHVLAEGQLMGTYERS